MQPTSFATHSLATDRHRTSWLETGPADGPLLFFLHGWPELGLIWRGQLEHFGAAGWRCIAPDMRGYGGSSVPTAVAAYAVRELVGDMLELHDFLGGVPAVWVGHDWGSEVVWALAAHHADRCRAVASLCVSYLPRGFALPTILPLVDRDKYPVDKYPAGQWDYFLFYHEHFAQAARDFEADVPGTLAGILKRSSAAAVSQRPPTATIRAKGGWFGPTHRAPAMPHDKTMLSQADFDAFVAAFEATGFRGADAWYLNDAANLAYAAETPDFGQLTLPVLFLHAAWDTISDTVHTPLADPMRANCPDLREVTLEGGHYLMLELPTEVNAALAGWLAAKNLEPG